MTTKHLNNIDATLQQSPYSNTNYILYRNETITVISQIS